MGDLIKLKPRKSNTDKVLEPTELEAVMRRNAENTLRIARDRVALIARYRKILKKSRG